MLQEQKRGSLSEQDEGQRYFSQLPIDQQQLLRVILAALKAEGLLKNECNPQIDGLHTLLCHAVVRNGRSLTDVTVGPGIYSPSDELAQDAVKYKLVSEIVPEGEVRCTHVSRYGPQGRCETLSFERQADSSLKLTGTVVHEIWG